MVFLRRSGRLCLSLLALPAVTASAGEENTWISLLDRDLSRWEVYLSYAHTTLDVTGPPLDSDGQPLAPVGLDNDTKGVFTVVEKEGDLVLRVSGEIYGCLGSLEEFENFQLSLQVRWGEKKWPPRLDEPRDTGLLYHSIGDYGVDYWLSWKLSQELQIMEDAFGDYWSIAGAKVDIRCEKTERGTYRYDPSARLVSDRGIGDYCRRRANHELPHGEWNTVELIAFGDRSIHIVNGHVVMTLESSRHFDGKQWQPLTSGALQIQSEAAEVYFRDIKIRPIEAIPPEYANLFQ